MSTTTRFRCESRILPRGPFVHCAVVKIGCSQNRQYAQPNFVQTYETFDESCFRLRTACLVKSESLRTHNFCLIPDRLSRLRVCHWALFAVVAESEDDTLLAERRQTSTAGDD